MTVYVPNGKFPFCITNLDVTFSEDIIYLLPNNVALDIFSQSEGGVPENSLIEWVIEDVFPAGKNFIDIGAHVGTYCINFAKKSNAKDIFAFECQRNTYNCLCGGIALNQIQNINTYNVALGSPKQVGKKDLHIISHDGGGSSICTELPTHTNPLKKETVQVLTLDSFGITNIGLIKMDVEGNELNVLKGAVQTLKASNYPKILFEVWDNDWYKLQRERLFSFLRNLGYEIIPILGYKQMFLAEIQCK